MEENKMIKYQIKILNKEDKETLQLDVEYKNLRELFIKLAMEMPRVIEHSDSIIIKEIIKEIK